MALRNQATTAQTAPARKPRPIYYPESDGKPVAETELHFLELVRLHGAMRARYADRPDVYVGSNLFLYYEEGNPRTSISPDLMVVLGAPKLPLRRTYKLWEEGYPPTFVLELTSKKTRREDLGKQRDVYARIGVAEYVLYDPLAEYLKPALQGFRLVNGIYQPLPYEPDGSLVSEHLGIRLTLVVGRPRLFDAATGEPLLSPEERVQAEAARANAAEAEVARLHALLAERQGGANGQQRRPPSP